MKRGVKSFCLRVIPVRRQDILGQIVGANGEKIALLGQLIRRPGGGRRLHHHPKRQLRPAGQPLPFQLHGALGQHRPDLPHL